jgi:hypothetical protein
MHPRYELLQVVRLVRDIPEEHLTKGMVGAVVLVLEAPHLAYEVEFADSQGRTIAQVALMEGDLEPTALARTGAQGAGSRGVGLLTLDEALAAVTRAALGPSPSDEDALGVMVLLHTHRLTLAEPVSDRPGARVFDALTQRHVAELISAAWKDRADPVRCRREHWYHQFNTLTPFEVVEDVVAPWDSVLARVRRHLLQSGLIRDVKPED